jgi:hypothetical protein
VIQASFFQKLMLTVLAGLLAACFIWGFRHVFEGANRAAGNYRETTTGAPANVPR